jgi:predicted amidophosphoribosyltransferase
MTQRNEATITRRELLDSLRGVVCPACGRRKGDGKTLCGGCYAPLTPAVKRDLYKRFGEGYEEAVQAAWAILNPERFHHAKAGGA